MNRARTVWFHRDYRRLTGGEVKHAHYVGHVLRAPGFDARVAFTGDLRDPALAAARARLWPAGAVVADWAPAENDILFVAGTDWRYLDATGRGGEHNPRINLLQHVRHADAGTELWTYLAHPAVRICVSEEVAEAVRAAGRARGPVLAIPNGTELAARDGVARTRPDPAPASPAVARSDRLRAGAVFGAIRPREAGRTRREGAPFGAGWAARPIGVLVVGYKRPALAADVSDRLARRGVPNDLLGFVDRAPFLALLREARVAVCLPRAREGFYLPALEAMACGCVVVTLDCVGNRGFCRDGDNCVVARPDAAGLADAVLRAVRLPRAARNGLLAGAAATVAAHSLEAERARFHAVLADVDALWAEARGPAAVAAGAPPRTAAPERNGGRLADPADRPLVDFMVVGAQKCGTTALASFLAAHPEIGMAAPKEAHLFDDPDYGPRWTRAEIDARYARWFRHCPDARLRGDATPIYLYFPETAAELARYNPALKVVVLLRDPAERAVSHYHMQRSRGTERRPFWLALALEPLLLLADRDPRRKDSPTRERAYRARGLYGRQLGNLYRHFPQERVLVLRQADLLERHDAALRRVFAFLGIDRDVRVPAARMFVGGPRPRHRLAKALLRLTYLADVARQRRLGVRL